MKRRTYGAMTHIAGPWLDHKLPHLIEPSALPLIASPAVYVGLTAGRVAYVGSVSRSDRNGLRNRLAEHRRLGRTWSHMVVVPLKPGTPTRVVREIEGLIGAVLDPPDSARLPRSRVPRLRTSRSRSQVWRWVV